MKKITLSIVLALLFLNGYSQLSTEEQKIKKVFFDFLHFYQQHEKKFNSFELYKGVGKANDAPPFHMQWKEVDRYILYLQKHVPFVGLAYIENEKKDFQFSDSCFKADPEEQLPIGFDFDRWGGGQETADYLVKWYTNKKNHFEVKINGNNAELRIGTQLSKEEMSWSAVRFVKEKGKWVMSENITTVD